MNLDAILFIGLLLLFIIGLVIRWFDDRYWNKPKPKKNKCTQCGCTDLSPLRSLNVKKCTSCGHEMDWNLDPGQLPLVRSNRMVKRDDS